MTTIERTERQPGWEKRFLYLVGEELDKPFDWINASCVDLMLAPVYACHGPKHPIFGVVPKYDTVAEALAALKAIGGLEKVLDAFFPTVPYSQANQADISLIKNKETDDMAGAVVLDGKVVGKHPPTKDDVTVRRNRTAFYLPLSAAYKIYQV